MELDKTSLVKHITISTDEALITLEDGSIWQILSSKNEWWVEPELWSSENTILIELEKSFFSTDTFALYNVEKDERAYVHPIVFPQEDCFVQDIQNESITIRHQKTFYKLCFPADLYNLDNWNAKDSILLGKYTYSGLAYCWSWIQSQPEELFIYNTNNHEKICIQLITKS